MARYRKLYPHMWDDAKVRALSRPPPNGQTLWVHLLAGEQTDIIPGVFKIGEAAFAEQLGWPVEGFREAFREVFRQGMVKASWKDRLVWVPNGLKWNPPESPNVVRKWAETWRHLPECELKVEIWQAFKAFFEGLGEGFMKAFREALPESVSSEQGAVIRDQHLQSTTENESTLIPDPPEAKKTRRRKFSPEAAPTGVALVRSAYLAGYERRYGKVGAWGRREGGQCAQLLGTFTPDELLELMPYFFAWRNPDVIDGGHPFGTGAKSFVMQVHKLRADVAHNRSAEIGAARAHARQAENAGAVDDAVAGAKEILRQQGVLCG